MNDQQEVNEINSIEDSISKTYNFEKNLYTVTPFSKYLALFLFIILPFVGFVIGYEYDKPSNELYTEKAEIKTSSGYGDEKLDIEQSTKPVSVYNTMVGDNILGLTVDNVNINPHEYSYGGKDFTVEFSGKKNITGNLYGPIMGCDVGISVNPLSGSDLPIFKEHPYNVSSLCFKNPTVIIDMIGQERISNGDLVTFQIDNFIFNYNRKDSGHMATFVKIINSQDFYEFRCGNE